MDERLRRIQEHVWDVNYRLSIHAEQEREADLITGQELKEALLSASAEILEDYPDDPRGSSCLVLGFTSEEKPLHVVLGLAKEMIVITVYRPAASEWINWRKRRGR